MMHSVGKTPEEPGPGGRFLRRVRGRIGRIVVVAGQRTRYGYSSFAHSSNNPALALPFEFFGDNVGEFVLEEAAAGVDNDP